MAACRLDETLGVDVDAGVADGVGEVGGGGKIATHPSLEFHRE
jgi:hypothetical protein